VPKLDFKYMWEKGVPAAPKTKELTIRNMGPLPTTINLKIDQPFSCTIEKLTLEKDKSDSILNDTNKKKYLVLSNISEMPVAYEWSFLEDAPVLDEMDEIHDAEQENKKRKKKRNKKLPINEVFDILPVSGLLMPGQTENVEFTYYAGNNLIYSGTAVCSCDGGPDYEVPIQGESNLVTYRLSTKEIDFGEVAYNESSSRDFFIENIGKVPFEFAINLSTVSRPGLIECSAMNGFRTISARCSSLSAVTSQRSASQSGPSVFTQDVCCRSRGLTMSSFRLSSI